MSLVLAGISHHTAPVELRERLAVCGQDPLAGLAALDGVKEGLFVSTCNRVEFVMVADDQTEAADRVARFVCRLAELDRTVVDQALYVKTGREAVRHLFRVAASLDSMIVGEPQILGQIKEAYRRASAEGRLGVILNRLLHKTFSVAKRVRTETGISDHAVSISYAAVEMARKIFGRLDGKRALLIGAGEMAELAAENLLANGATDLTVANRTLDRALEVAQRFGGRAVGLEELEPALIETDIVITSTAATEPILTTKLVKATIRPRKRRPLFIIDIAVPRDVEAGAGDLENVFLYDIDDLQAVVERNVASRRNEARRAERIVEEEAIKFEDWLDTLKVVPTIKAIQERLEDIRRGELDKTIGQSDLTPEQIEALEVMTRAMMKKVLHHPATWLKRNFRNPDNLERYLDSAHRLFGLDKPADNGDDQGD